MAELKRLKEEWLAAATAWAAFDARALESLRLAPPHVLRRVSMPVRLLRLIFTHVEGGVELR